MRKNYAFIIIALITALGVGLRLYAAPRMAIDVDERVYFQAALHYAEDIRQGQWKMLAWDDYNAEHPPFYKLIYGVALLTQPRLDQYNSQLFIDGKAMYKIVYLQWGMAGRYVSVFFGGLTVAALALVNPLAGLLYAVDSIAVQFNSTMFLEALPTLASFIAALCYLRWCQRLHSPEKPRLCGAVWLALSAGCLGAAVASKYTYAVVGAAILIHLAGSVLFKKAPPSVLWMLAGWGLLALAAFFACDTYLWPHPAARLISSLTFHFNHTQSDRAQIVNLPFYQPFIWFSQPFFKNPGNAAALFPLRMDTLIGLAALLGLPRLVMRQPLYFIWLVLGFGVLMAWPVKWVQYGMIVIVPLCLSASLGLVWIKDELALAFRRLARSR